MKIDREYAAALIGADIGEAPWGLDERARIIRDRVRPELAEAVTPRDGLISAPAACTTATIRRYRLRANGRVEALHDDHERAGIIRLAAALTE